MTGLFQQRSFLSERSDVVDHAANAAKAKMVGDFPETGGDIALLLAPVDKIGDLLLSAC